MLEQLRLSQNWMLSDYLIDILKSKICSHWGLEALANLAESESCDPNIPSLETFAVIAIRTLPRITLKDVLDVLPDRATVVLNRVNCSTPKNAPRTPMFTPFMQAITQLLHDALCDSNDDSHATLVTVAWRLLSSNEFDFLRPTIDLLDNSFRSADNSLWNAWLTDYIVCTLNPGLQAGLHQSSIIEVEQSVMFSIAQAHVRHFINDQSYSPLLCTVFLQTCILESCLHFVRYLRLWGECHMKLDTKSLISRIQSLCMKCPQQISLSDMMNHIQSFILDSGVECVMNWLHEVINSQGAADADASVKGFLASFMPIMRELRSGPISNFSTMARTLQDQHPALHAKIVVLLTFSMVFAECCDSLTTVFRSLTGEILRGFVGQASQCSDFLPVMLNIVAFVRDHGSLSAQGRQQLLRVTQDSLFFGY